MNWTGNIEGNFVPIAGYPRYLINENGVIVSTKGKILSTRIKRNYLSALLTENLSKKNCSVHRLVAKTFIPNPENKPCVNHIDGNKLNNNVENLEWVTWRENTIHAVKTGLFKYRGGPKSHFSKLTPGQVGEIRRLWQEGKTKRSALAKMFDVDERSIYNIIHKRTWKEQPEIG